MNQNSTSAIRQQVLDFMNDPYAQAILTGTLTLIPARNYPTWLRRGIIWGPTAAGAAGGAYLATNRNARRKLATKIAVAEQSVSISETLRPPEPPASLRYKGKNRPVSLIVTGCVLGGVASLAMIASFWADERIEQGLRRVKVPFPRAVMSLAAGGFTWWSLKRDQDTASHSSR